MSLARGLERVAEEQHKSLEEWASAELSSHVASNNGEDQDRPGSPAAIFV